MTEVWERTCIMIKPDGVQRGTIGKIIKRFEQKGFKLIALKLLNASEDQLKLHYSGIADQPFFPRAIAYMRSGPVVPMVWEGLNIIKISRKLLGQTDPAMSAPGTIRGDFCIQIGHNIAHASDSVEDAEKEINLWFTPDQLVSWKSLNLSWVYEN